jgi:hypothetical protein
LNLPIFIAKVFYNIGIKVYNSLSTKPSHIELNEIITNEYLTLISDDLLSDRNENSKKLKISGFLKGTGEPKTSSSGIKYRFVKT